MGELLNGLFKCLDIDSSTGLAIEDGGQSMSPFQRQFYTQVHDKLGVDAVYFLRDANGIAKIPLIYFSFIKTRNINDVASFDIGRKATDSKAAQRATVCSAPAEVLFPRTVESSKLFWYYYSDDRIFEKQE